MAADTARGLVILREEHRAPKAAEFGRAVGYARNRRYIILLSES